MVSSISSTPTTTTPTTSTTSSTSTSPTTLSSTGLVTFSGLASGVNTAALIASMVAQRQQPITNLQNQVTAEKAQAAAVGEINTRLASLLTAVQQFTDPNYLLGKTATVQPAGSSPQVSVTATSAAAVSSFQVTVNSLATATSVGSPSAIGAAIDPTAVLNTTNLATAVTAGTFTVNGTSISVDPTTDTLNSVMGKIQAAIPGSTVSLVNDASGRPNLIQISSSSPVTLGAGGDTSNFLAATNLLASPGGNTRTSTASLGLVEAAAPMSSAHLANSLGGTSGTFTINGQSFSWNADQESVNNVVSAINANSAAGVVASYDPNTDGITLTSTSTGSTAIALQDTSGSFLQAMGLTGAQTLGKNAEYTINTGNGPQTQYSTSNTVQNALPGVTLNLLAQGTSPDTVTLGQDVAGAVTKVQSLVTQINGVLDDIRTQTAINPPSTTPSSSSASTSTTATPQPTQPPLSGDIETESIADNLKEILTGVMPGVSGVINTLGQIGISFGAIGSAAGTTNDLVVDTTALTNALQSNPGAVSNLFSAFASQTTVNSGGAGNITGVSGQATGARVAGSYNVTTSVNGDGTANMTAVFTPTAGGATTTTSATNVAAGSQLQSLISGLTLQMPSAFTNGSDTLTLATPTMGLEPLLEQYLTPLSQPGGSLFSVQQGYNSDVSDLQSQITEMNDNLAQYKTSLITKFTAMEVAVQQLQTQQQTLNAAGLTGQLTTGSGSNFTIN